MGRHLARAVTMSWIEQAQHAPFENQPIDGLYFLDGNILARRLGFEPAKYQKYPLIAFPSGLACDVWEGQDPKNPTVHLFGEMDLSLRATRDEAFTHANDIAEQVGYQASKIGETDLELRGHNAEEHLLVSYDNHKRSMIDVKLVLPKAGEREYPPRLPLLDAASREKLPPLYSQEKLGLEAVAQVKFFTPDAHWVWYASEASALLTDDTTSSLKEKAPHDPDVVDVLFFGLVAGDALELGHFSLSELEDAHGPLGLSIEHDRYYEPQTLKALQSFHEQGQPAAFLMRDIPDQDPRHMEQLVRLKDGLLDLFGQLPAEHQATIGLVVVKTIMDGEWGAWFKDALSKRYGLDQAKPSEASPIRPISRDDLRETHLTEEQIAQLTDENLGQIAKTIHDHLMNDTFWDELPYITEHILAMKRKKQ
jgi:hypothetical protein